MLTYEKDFPACVDKLQAGDRVEIDVEMFDYWLEVLPPIYMGRAVKLPDGETVRASFGFAEGSERITAFWRVRDNGATRYFAQRTDEINH